MHTTCAINFAGSIIRSSAIRSRVKQMVPCALNNFSKSLYMSTRCERGFMDINPGQRVSDNNSFAVSQKKKGSLNCIHKRELSSKTYPEHEVVKFPALSPTMTSGNIVEWNKKIGDKIEEGDSILIIETDKSCMDFEILKSGYLAYISPKTESINIGEPIGILVDDEKLVEAFSDFDFGYVSAAPVVNSIEVHTPTASQKEEENYTSNDGKRILSSPSAKRLAKSLNVDLSNVTGTGPNGRIVNNDVIAASSGSTKQKPSTSQPSATADAEFIDTPISLTRSAIIKVLAKAKPLIPEYSVTLSANISELIDLKYKFNASSDGKFKITINDLIIMATCKAIKLFPDVNSHFLGNAIRTFKPINLAIAISTDQGLYAPVLKDAGNMSLLDISKNVKEISKKTREYKLSPADMSGGTFAISNMGMYSIESFNSIIVSPQVAILSIGTIIDRYEPSPINNNTLIKKQYINFTITSDHRAIDGSVAAKWIKQLKDVIENPHCMFL